MPRTSDKDTFAFLSQLEKHASKLSAAEAVEAALVTSFGRGDAFRWARVDGQRDYMPPNFSGDGAIYGAGDMMHRRIRDQVRNDPVAKGITRKFTDLVVGSGLKTYSDPIDMGIMMDDPGQLMEQLDMALEMDSEFQRWYEDEKSFDVEEKLSGPDMERAGFKEQVTVGDTIVLRVFRTRRNRDIPLCYQLIEREQLDRSKDRTASTGQNRIVNGIELDPYNRAVNYWIYDAHPGDSFQAFQSLSSSTQIPADRVMHAYAFNRPSQSIGNTWMDCIGQDTYDEESLVTSELQSAAKGALLSIYVNRDKPYRGNLGLTDGRADSDRYGNGEVKLGRSPLAAELGPNDKVGMVEPTRPNTDVGVFLDHLAHRKSTGTGLSYYTLTDKFDNTNYTGFRGSLLNEDMMVQPIQNWYGRKVNIPQRREFNRIAAAFGLYKKISPKDFLANERRFQTFDLISPGRQYLDPEPETGASLANLRAGLSNLKIECARRGLHWIMVLRQCYLENQLIELLKLVIDFSKGQGGQVDSSTRQDQGKSADKAKKKPAA